MLSKIKSNFSCLFLAASFSASKAFLAFSSGVSKPILPKIFVIISLWKPFKNCPAVSAAQSLIPPLKASPIPPDSPVFKLLTCLSIAASKGLVKPSYIVVTKLLLALANFSAASLKVYARANINLLEAVLYSSLNDLFSLLQSWVNIA